MSQQNAKEAPLRFLAMPTAQATAFRTGVCDANGNKPERMISDGGGYPCRHCLRDIPAGKAMLILSWSPFEKNHAYAESGPVFLCEEACEQHGETAGLPEVIRVRPRFMLRGYDADERIVDGSGAMIETTAIEARARELLDNPEIVSVHVRSGTNTCFTCRIEQK